MGRAAKHNWRKLFLEYNQGRYKSVAEFAEKKGLNYDQARKAFKKYESEAPDPEPGKTGQKNRENPGKKNAQKNKPGKKQNPHPWEKLRQQFLAWPDEKLQAYLTQLEERLAELKEIPFEELPQDEIKELGQLRRERRAILSNPDPDVKCTAHNHKGQPCGNPAERGKRVCWNHGGAPGSGCPHGAKNALKHGAYETIWLDQLDDDERILVDQVNQDKNKALEDEIKLLTIRERRMLARIANLAGEEFSVVKKKHEKGKGPQGLIDKESTEEQATLGQIQTIEQELTKVQGKKLKAIELRHKLEMGNNINLSLTGKDGGPIETKQTVDLSSLTEEELIIFERVVAKLETSNTGGD